MTRTDESIEEQRQKRRGAAVGRLAGLSDCCRLFGWVPFGFLPLSAPEAVSLLLVLGVCGTAARRTSRSPLLITWRRC